MKVQNIVELKSNFSFEAPVLLADKLKPVKKSSQSLIDLNNLLAPVSKDYFLVRVTGESMINESIFSGDLLIVKRNEQPKDGKIVIAALNGEMAVKIYRVLTDGVYLFAANEKFLPIEIMPFWNFEIQGVVKHIIHNV